MNDKAPNPTEQYRLFEKIAARAAIAASSTPSLILVFGFFIFWVIAGPFMHFSGAWESMMTIVSAVVAYFMVFLLARSQSKDYMAMQIKLNEIIAALNGANNNLISIENLSEAQLAEMHKRYQVAAEKVHEEHPGEVSTEAIAVHEIEIIEEKLEEKLEEVKEILQEHNEAAQPAS